MSLVAAVHNTAAFFAEKIIFNPFLYNPINLLQWR